MNSLEANIAKFKCGKITAPNPNPCEGTMLLVYYKRYIPFMFFDEMVEKSSFYKCSACDNKIYLKQAFNK